MWCYFATKKHVVKKSCQGIVTIYQDIVTLYIYTITAYEHIVTVCQGIVTLCQGIVTLYSTLIYEFFFCIRKTIRLILT